MFLIDIESGEEMWYNGEGEMPPTLVKPAKKDKKKPVCACGRRVCCGKHKNGQCACQKKGRERG